jgi:hypothetical protein
MKENTKYQELAIHDNMARTIRMHVYTMTQSGIEEKCIYDDNHINCFHDT